MFKHLMTLFAPPEDDMIDVYIAERGCKSYRPGMDRPDMSIINRVGNRRWSEVKAAQAKVHGGGAKVLSMASKVEPNA